MEFSSPKWELRNQRCTCCDGEGELVFEARPACGLIVLICAEIGTIYEIQNRQAGQILGSAVLSEDVCTKCGKSHFEDFRKATSDEVRGLGFQSADYR
jgi:hypothetical protein